MTDEKKVERKSLEAIVVRDDLGEKEAMAQKNIMEDKGTTVGSGSTDERGTSEIKLPAETGIKEKWLENRRGQKMHLIESEGNQGDGPLFILCHGFTGSVESNVIAVAREVLTELGAAHLSIDFTNNLNESDGEFRDLTVRGEIQDLEDVMEAYAPRYFTFVLVGHSMGCTVVTHYAGLTHEKSCIRGIFLVAPPFSMLELFELAAEAEWRENKAYWPGSDRQMWLPIQKTVEHQKTAEQWKEKGEVLLYVEKCDQEFALGYGFYEDIRALENEKAYRQITSPVTLIYSLADQSVPPEQSERLFTSLGSKEKKKIVVEDAPHSFDTEASTALLRRVLRQELQKWIG